MRRLLATLHYSTVIGATGVYLCVGCALFCLHLSVAARATPPPRGPVHCRSASARCLVGPRGRHREEEEEGREKKQTRAVAGMARG